MPAKKKQEVIEWVGGIAAMPTSVVILGEPDQPEILLWVGPQLEVLGTMVSGPGTLIDLAAENLGNTIAEPLCGRPHAPDRIRVASPALAEALSAGHPGIQIVCGPTPEIDTIHTVLCEHLQGNTDAEETHLTTGVGPEMMAAFFRAAATFFRAKPWKSVPTGDFPLSVSIPKFEVSGAPLSVIGQGGKSLGFILFSGFDDFVDYMEAAEAMERGEEATLPPLLGLNFEPRSSLSPALRKEVADHHWEIASANAYPWLVALDENGDPRSPTPREFTIAEAIAFAIPLFLKEKKAILAAWNGGEPVERTLVVETHVGDVEISLRVPYEQEPTE